MFKRLLLCIITAGILASKASADSQTPRAGATIITIGSTGWGPKLNANTSIFDSSAAMQGVANTFSAANTFTAPVTLTNTPLTLTGVSGTVTSASTITASVFIGSGTALTALDASQLTTGTIPAARIGTGAIDTTKLASDSVTTVKILDQNVTTAKIADSAVDTSKLGTASVTTAKIANSAVDTTKLASDSVTTAKILDLNVTTAKIAALAVDTSKLASDAVTTAKVLDLNITTAKLANSAVDTSKLASDAVTTAKILDLNVTTAKLAAASVDTSKLASDAVTTAKILDLNVTTAKLAAASVDTSKLATDSVTTAKILSQNVTTAKIADSAVDTSKLATDSVTGAKILSGAVDTNKLATDAVTSAKLLSDSTSFAKVSGGAAYSSGGLIGIGTSSPGAKLDVVGGDVRTDARVVVGTVGNLTDPTINRQADPNTGIWWPTADNIGVVTGGVEAVRVNASQNVGIGTSTPGSKLDVNGDATIRGQETVVGSETVNGNMLVNSAVRVAGGTIFGHATGTCTGGNTCVLGSGAASLDWGDTSTVGRLSYSGTNAVIATTAGDISISPNGTNNVILAENGGKVAIGTTTIDEALNLVNGQVPRVTFSASRSVNADIGQLNFKNATDSLNTEARIEANRIGSNNSGELAFYTRNNGGSLTKQVTIGANGNVGIGTGTAISQVDIYKTSSPDLRIRDDSSDMQFIPSGGVNFLESSAVSGGSPTGAADFSITDHNTANRWFTVKSNGFVGIGTSGPTQKLSISSGTIYINGNVPNKLTGGDGSGAAQAHMDGSNSGGSAWYLDALGVTKAALQFANPDTYLDYSGTYHTRNGAGAGIEVMTVLNGGNVGINSTSPAPYMLEVSTGGVGRYGLHVKAGSAAADTIVKFADSADNVPMVMLGSGKVGIGTTTPSNLLTVWGSGASILINDTASSPSLVFGENGINNASIGSAATGLVTHNGSSGIRFRPNSDSDSLVDLFIAQEHNLGMGTSSPGAKLDVQSNVGPTGYIISASSQDATHTIFNVQGNGRVGIGTAVAGASLDVGGSGIIVSSLTVAGHNTLGAWYAWTPTLTGVTSPSINFARYQRTGKTICVAFSFSGTSNSTAFTFTLPFATFSGLADFISGQAYDNGVYLTTSLGTVSAASSATVDLYRDPSGQNAWTASGAKQAQGSGCYETP